MSCRDNNDIVSDDNIETKPNKNYYKPKDPKSKHHIVS